MMRWHKLIITLYTAHMFVIRMSHNKDHEQLYIVQIVVTRLARLTMKWYTTDGDEHKSLSNA